MSQEAMPAHVDFRGESRRGNDLKGGGNDLEGGIPGIGKQPGDLVRPHALTPLTDCVSCCGE